ncbi:MAG: DUF4412 domain-containing protein [Thermoanaerobaculia bacterium]
MKRVLLNVLAGAALAAAPAFAQFEGEIDMKITSPGMSGMGKMYVSKAGYRSTMDLQAAKTSMKMTTLMKVANPDVMYMINDQARTYAEVNLKDLQESVAKTKSEKEPYTVKVLGTERVLGYSTKHVLLSRPSERSEMEIWTTKDILGVSYEAMRGLMRRDPNRDEGTFTKALRDAGADGFFVRMITREKGKTEPTSTMELTKVEKKSVPGSLFEIPPGYTKQEGMMGAAGVMASPEQQEQMRKAMESLTPEQRKQLEEMMKQRQKN